MAKAKAISNEPGSYLVKVPCPCHHHKYDSRWEFNGSFDRPTFSGSMLINTSYDGTPYVCHSVITNDGMIRYIDDGTTHDLRGKTVPLEDFE